MSDTPRPGTLSLDCGDSNHTACDGLMCPCPCHTREIRDTTPAEQSGLFPDYEFPELKKLYGTPAPEPVKGGAHRPRRRGEAKHLTVAIEAQVHATLAHVEETKRVADELHTANLIAYLNKWTDDEVLGIDALIRERLGLS